MLQHSKQNAIFLNVNIISILNEQLNFVSLQYVTS